VPVVVPAVVALAGCFGGLWYLTLSQNPENPMPSWSPAVGWSAALGSLALAAALAWLGMVRRRCPACGSTQMLDAMEEEGLIASERLAAQEAAAAAVRAEMGGKPAVQSDQELRPQIEAELRSAHAKEIVDQLAAKEKQLRLAIEQDFRGRLVRELRPQVEHDVRRNVEKELRGKLEEELRATQATLEATIEAKLRPEIESQLRMTLAVPAAAITPTPVSRREVAVTPTPVSRPQAAVTPTPVSRREAARTPTPVSRPDASAAPTPVSRPDASATPTPVSKPDASATPTPVSRPDASVTAVTPTPVSRPQATVTHTPGPVIRKAKPALPHAQIDTAPLSLRSPKAPAASSAEETNGQTPTPSPYATDGYERARRRARVILSDLSLYHREALLKAAQSDDAKAALGHLWRDAVISFKQVAQPDAASGAASYLEEELERHLSQLRKG
jgi:hypothetical protein